MIRKNDTVMVITGKFKGKTGKVIAVLTERGRALVEKLNVVKRHQKPTQKLPQGGIVEKEASINVSNVMVVCASCGKHTRIGHTVLPDGTKVRSCRRCNSALDK